MTTTRAPRGRWRAAALAVVLLGVSACDAAPSGSASSGAGARVNTTDVPLPGGYEPVLVAPWGQGLLVGSRVAAGSEVRPRLTVVDASGGSREVAVTAVSPTAFRSEWLLAATREGAVDLVGGVASGAHSNTRWSTWRGSVAGVRELPQPFETFGGWGAGALVSLVQTPRGPVIVGSWESRGAGLDIALWHPSGERWIRASSTGTALASTRAELVSARSAASDRDGMLLVGSVTLLRESGVTQRAAVWRAPGPDGPWTRTDLPGDGALGEAHGAACDAGGTCTVVGVLNGTLRGWTLPPEGAPGILPLPALPVGGHDLLTAPLLGDAGPTVVLASGGTLRVLTVPAAPQR